jgi:HlyD family secretion protein
MSKRSLILLAIVAALVAATAYYYENSLREPELPDNIATGNGRIEAEEVHVATVYAGRVVEVLAREGDMVKKGEVLARMDSGELEASLASARADVARAQEGIAEGTAEIAQRRSQLTFAQQELARATYLVERGHIAESIAQQRQSERDAAEAALNVARAHLAAAERSVEAAEAEVHRIEIRLDDTVLVAPIDGRVQYRLAEPGEVLAAGGKVVTLLDLTDVYMTIFLPTSQAGRVALGADARIILDAAPQYVIPAKVSFVASEAQFTPREVETKTERERLMFRVKVKIDPDLLLAYIDQVKTGLPGEAFVLLGSGGTWPDALAVRLPTTP